MYGARGLVHLLAAHAAAIHSFMMTVWNKPRTDPLFIASITDLINTLLSHSLLISPFNSSVPYLPYLTNSLTNTMSGRWLIAISAIGYTFLTTKVLKGINEYIMGHFPPKGKIHIWTHPKVTEAQYFNSIAILNGIHYLSDICTHTGHFITYPQFTLRNPNNTIPLKNYNELIHSLLDLELSPPTYSRPLSFIEQQLTDMAFPPLTWLAIFHWRGSNKSMWVARVKNQTNHPPQNPAALTLEWWASTPEKRAWNDQETLPPVNLKTTFHPMTEIVWEETDLHTKAFQIQASLNNSTRTATLKNRNAIKQKLEGWHSHTVDDHQRRRAPTDTVPLTCTPLRDITIKPLPPPNITYSTRTPTTNEHIGTVSKEAAYRIIPDDPLAYG